MFARCNVPSAFSSKCKDNRSEQICVPNPQSSQRYSENAHGKKNGPLHLSEILFDYFVVLVGSLRKEVKRQLNFKFTVFDLYTCRCVALRKLSFEITVFKLTVFDLYTCGVLR